MVSGYRIFLSLTAQLIIHSMTAYSDGWIVMTQKDLEAIYMTLKENHPGYLESNSPFKQWLNCGYMQASTRAKDANTYEKYLFTLYHYISGFHDTHLDIWPTLTKESIQWPGFIARYDTARDAFLVSSVSRDQQTFHHLPPLDAEILLCDELSPKEYLETYIFPYYGGIKNIAAHYHKFAENLLADTGNPWIPKPQKCIMKIDNKTTTVPLEWHEISKKDFYAVTPNQKKRLPTPGKSSFMQGRAVWVSLPTFNPETTENQKALEKLIEELQDDRSKECIVLDLRGNDGGYGTWVLLLLESLFGKEYVDVVNSQIEPQTYWRASEDNINHLEKNILPYLGKNFGTTSKNYQGTEKLISELKKKKNTHELVSLEPEKKSHPLLPKPLSTAKVYVVSDSSCISACLELFDLLLHMKNVTFLGLPSGVDTKYTNTRVMSLPSGLLNMQLPMSMEHGRIRQDNVPYLPQYTFNGDIYDTESLKNWVASIIQNDSKPH